MTRKTFYLTYCVLNNNGVSNSQTIFLVLTLETYGHTLTFLSVWLKWLINCLTIKKKKDAGLIPGLRRSAGGGHGNPLQCSCLENPMNRDPGGLQSMGSQRVRNAWSSLAHKHTLRLTVWLTYCWKSFKNYLSGRSFERDSFHYTWLCGVSYKRTI